MYYTSLLFAAILAKLASAYTTPTNATWGALLTPDKNDPVTQGQKYKITWDPSGHATDGQTISLVLCNGPSNNCIPQDTSIAEAVPAAQRSFDWSVPCSLPAGTQSTATGYGMLIIVDGTGEFQYSTQFSVRGNSACSSSNSSSDALASATSSVSGTVLSGTVTRNSSATVMTGSSTTGVTVTTGVPASTVPSARSSATQSTNEGGVRVASGAAAGGFAIAAAMLAL